MNPVGFAFANEINLTQAASTFQAQRLYFKGPEPEWSRAAAARVANLRTGAADLLKTQNQRPSIPGPLAG
jgi:hypothetical protein